MIAIQSSLPKDMKDRLRAAFAKHKTDAFVAVVVAEMPGLRGTAECRAFGGGAPPIYVVTIARDVADGVTLCETVAHEMCHVEQFHSGRLLTFPAGYVWDEGFYANDEIDRLGGDAPWEVEAYAAERA